MLENFDIKRYAIMDLNCKCVTSDIISTMSNEAVLHPVQYACTNTHPRQTREGAAVYMYRKNVSHNTSCGFHTLSTVSNNKMHY